MPTIEQKNQIGATNKDTISTIDKNAPKITILAD